MQEQAPAAAELQALRRAADQGDWNGCRDATERLMLRLPVRQAVKLTHEQVARRISMFERHHPHVPWVRAFIEASGGGGAEVEGREWPEAENDFSGPGANTFTGAVESLWRGSLSLDDPRECVEHLVDAISGAIMAERVESWGLRHPGLWASWFRLATEGNGDPALTDIQVHMMEDPEAARLQREAWMDVAQRLEEAVGAAADKTP
jgi:hypothetical protein